VIVAVIPLNQLTPDIRSSITAFFPNHDESAILRTLTNTGRGLSHARSCVLYYSLLHCCRKNGPLLKRIVSFANSSPENFDTYINRYSRWQSDIDQLLKYQQFRFFEPVLQRFAIEASQFRFAWLTSHYTICTSLNDAHAEQNDLYFVPIFEKGVFITTDHDARGLMNTPEISQYCDGKLSDITRASSEMINSIKKYYELDAAAPIAE
jgi:hypothetical protein